MFFREPKFLWLLIVVAVVALPAILLQRRRAHALRAFADEVLLPRLIPDLNPRRRVLRTGLRLAVLALILVALAGPKWGFRWEEVRREGIDLIVALDTSRSMLATDVKPNRLERAKLAVLDMVKLLQGDRIGLVTFAGTAFLECPLTLDYAAFERSLRAQQVGIIPVGGTSIARAIAAALAGFEARQGKHEALVLITDGEDHEGKVDEAAQAAAERGVKIFTVGIGTAEGELIPARQDGSAAFVKDRQGQVVKSRLNEDILRQIAVKTGGAYVRGLGAALGLDEVFRDHIAKMERREVASTLERRYEERFQVPLLLALLLLFVEGLIGDRKSEHTRRPLWARLRHIGAAGNDAANKEGKVPDVTALLALFLLAPFLTGFFDRPGDRAAEGNRLYQAGKYAEAVGKYGEGLVDQPQSPLLRFNLGTALYKQGKYAEAIGEWEKLLAAGAAQWEARAAYNVGNAHYQLGQSAEKENPQAALSSYQQALLSYRRAMSADPHDQDAKFNHEFVSRRLEELRKRIEEEKKQQEQQQEQAQHQPEGQTAGEQQPQETPGEEDSQVQGAEPQEPTPADEQGQQQVGEQESPTQQQQQGSAGQEVPSQGQAGSEGDSQGLQAGEQQAAQAVLNTAQSEELEPQEVQRPLGIAVPAEPVQDW